MSDGTVIIKCVEAECGSFEFTAGEQAFYADKGYPPPKRCKEHRIAKRKRVDEYNKAKNSPFSPNNWRKGASNYYHGDKEMFNP